MNILLLQPTDTVKHRLDPSIIILQLSEPSVVTQSKIKSPYYGLHDLE